MNIKKLENWYKKNHRQLPFRASKDPYQIWVSEIMLQQTQMDTVIPYFNRFIKVFPTVDDLAKISEEELLKHVQGLGYYRRFKYMLKAAKKIVNDNQSIFPSTYTDVLKLPGVGEYTAGAIMSIAYDKAYAATDGNVIRVLARYYLIETDMREEKNKKEIKKLNQSLVEKSKPSIYTQAIMELGALVCKPASPKCHECPLADTCKAYKKNVVEDLPYLSKAKNKKSVFFNTFVIEDGDYLYLRKRTETLLGGMYEFPQFEKHLKHPFDDQKTEQLTSVKHVFTHLIWHMDVYGVKLIGQPLKDWVKIPKNHLHDYPMAIAHKKIANQL